jgi:hypothetical protein
MIASAATAALLAGAAYAQNAPAGDTAVNPPSANQLPPGVATGNATTTQGKPSGQAGSGDSTAPSAASPSSDAASVAPAAGAPAERAPAASAGTDLISNGPVPDTPANRAKYGQPLSHAGRATKPAGN